MYSIQNAEKPFENDFADDIVKWFKNQYPDHSADQLLWAMALELKMTMVGEKHWKKCYLESVK